MYKLSHQTNGAWVEYVYPPHFSMQSVAGGSNRLVTGWQGHKSDVFTRLVECLEPPYRALYILLTSRGEGEPARYHSGEMNKAELAWLLKRFSAFLSGDGRHDIWVHSPGDRGTVVWDHHNLIFAYGPIDQFCSVLEGAGLSRGTVEVPVPHTHHFRQEFDADAASILAEIEWTRTPLRPEDED